MKQLALPGLSNSQSMILDHESLVERIYAMVEIGKKTIALPWPSQLVDHHSDGSTRIKFIPVTDTLVAMDHHINEGRVVLSGQQWAEYWLVRIWMANFNVSRMLVKGKFDTNQVLLPENLIGVQELYFDKWGNLKIVTLCGGLQLNPACIYLIKAAAGLTKIGWSNDPESRCKDMQVGSPVKLELIATSPFCFGSKRLEKFLHRRFTHNRVNGEWFALTDKDIESVREIFRKVNKS